MVKLGEEKLYELKKDTDVRSDSEDLDFPNGK